MKERMADLEMAGGSLDKARSLAQEYLDACSARLGVHSAECVRTCYKLAKIAAAQGDLARADSLFTRSMEVGRSLADPSTDPDLASTLRDRSAMYLQAGRYADAMTDLVRAREIMVRIHGPVHYKVAQIDVIMAEVAFQDRNMDVAIAHSSTALEMLKDRMDHLQATTGPVYDPSPELLPDAVYWHVRAQHEKEHATAPPGRWNAEIDLAVDALARNRHTITDDASRLYIVGSQKRLFDLAIDFAYEDHARTGLTSDLDRFLRLTEADRSILLKGRLNRFASLKFADVPDSIRAREQEIIKSLDVDKDDPGTAQDLDRTERAYQELLTMLQRDYPKYYQLRYGEPQVGLAEVRKELLGPDRDLLLFAATPEHLYLLLITEDEAVLEQVDGKGLADTVHRSREAVIARDVHAERAAGTALYDMVFKPISDRSRASHLYVVPDADLHLIDLEMLPTGRMGSDGDHPELLLDRYAITYLLSVTTAIQFADLKGGKAHGALAVAPGFSDELKDDYLSRIQDPMLVDHRYLDLVRQPFAVRTAEALGGLLSARVMVGQDASETGFREQARKYG
ncbi:MAG: CHAT domain-containing protein, partial [Flavobacteriales bacterium]|nr:CHAT domain-containing protein [Flavobacteriales bacterium]